MAVDGKTLLIIVLVAFTLYAALKAHKELEGKVHELDERLKRMEQASRLRMPYSAYEAVLDAMAGLDVEEREAQFHTSIRENIRAHLTKAMSAGTNREEK